MATVIVLYGPKAVGKTQIARLLERAIGCLYVDCDALIGDRVGRGVVPHPVDGWLLQVQEALRDALRRSELVSVEATVAWDSDWRLARELEEEGLRVVRIWVSTSWPVSLQRLRLRDDRRVPMTETEAEAIYQRATARVLEEAFDLTIDTSQPLDKAESSKLSKQPSTPSAVKGSSGRQCKVESLAKTTCSHTSHVRYGLVAISAATLP